MEEPGNKARQTNPYCLTVEVGLEFSGFSVGVVLALLCSSSDLWLRTVRRLKLRFSLFIRLPVQKDVGGRNLILLWERSRTVR